MHRTQLECAQALAKRHGVSIKKKGKTGNMVNKTMKEIKRELKRKGVDCDKRVREMMKHH